MKSNSVFDNLVFVFNYNVLITRYTTR